jgi:hypothetical protein
MGQSRAAMSRQSDVGGRKYWPVTLDSAAVGHWHNHTHVAVKGVVAPRYPIMETDGDLHIKLLSLDKTGRFIVAECIPNLMCRKPRAGDTITVFGISRQDSEHGWQEVHPVEKWQ